MITTGRSRRWRLIPSRRNRSVISSREAVSCLQAVTDAILSCPFCQNHDISMNGAEKAEWRMMTPEELADLAEQCRPEGNIGIAFTYNEPLIGYEYVRDTARLIRERGMKNVLVTNGTAELQVLEELIPYIDAMNIDLKGFTEEYYRKLGGELEVVKRFITRAAADCHVELTTLIVPGENDRTDEMEREAEWIASVDPKISLHVTRFFPRYRMTDRDATEVETVYRLKDTAKKYLKMYIRGTAETAVPRSAVMRYSETILSLRLQRVIPGLAGADLCGAADLIAEDLAVAHFTGGKRLRGSHRSPFSPILQMRRQSQILPSEEGQDRLRSRV